jgi:hypothetical protein
MRGTPEAYAKLAQKDKDTLYFICAEDADDGLLYLGEKLISGEGDKLNTSSINDLLDVIINTESLVDKSFLTYDASNSAWVNTPVEKLVFVGATTESAGLAGLVPAPEIKDTNLFLRSDGTWAKIETTSPDAQKNKVLTVENRDASVSHASLIATATANSTPVNGDVVIIKDFIAEDKWQYTAYVYDGSNWAAMVGNYDAESVYFDDDILVTTKIGTIQELVNGQATLVAKGKNVKQVLSSLLAERKAPTATLPAGTIELTNATTSYEVGSKVIPTWKTTFTNGSYTYGPTTGVVDAGGSVTSTKDTTAVSVAAGSLNGATGSFAEYQVEDSTKYYAYLTYGWDEDTVTPVDNFGDASTDISKNLPIQSASNKKDTSDKYISGYRKWFKGGLTSDSTTALTSDIIRDNLTGSSSAVSSSTFDLKAADYAGCKRIVIAIPSAANKSVTKVLLKSASNADITSEFVKQANTLDVEGANDYTAKPYKIWIYEPAALDSTEVYTITLG